MPIPSASRKLFALQSNRFEDLVFSSVMRTHRLGKTFYVDSNTGNNSYSGTRLSSPVATIAQAMSLATASQGDIIFVLPQHAETVTSTIAIKAGVRLIGLQIANLRPVITVNGATDLFNMNGANGLIQGFELTIITTDAATALINMAAAKCVVRDCKFIPSSTAENVVDVITIASGANDGIVENCTGFNTIVAVNSWISIEAAVARFTIQNNFFRGDVATAGIIDGATATQLGLFGNKIITIGTNIPACILDSNPTGQAIGNHFYGTDATIANNAQWGTALILGDNFTRGGTGSAVSASDIIPALDT